MVDENKDVSFEKPSSSIGRNAKKDVNLFPALTEKRGASISSVRTPPSRIGTQISVFSPVSFEEAIDIVECLRGRAATTISLENMKKIDANRLVDFVAGASAALDGDFHKLSEQVYLFCPSNIKITAPGKLVAGGLNLPGDSILNGGLGGLGSGLSGGSLDFLYPSSAPFDNSTGSSWSTIH